MSGSIKLFFEQGLPFPMNINKTASEKKRIKMIILMKIHLM